MSATPSPALAVDPMARITGVGARVSVTVSVILALVLHAGLATAGVGALAIKDYLDWQKMLQRHLHDHFQSEYEVEIVREPEPPRPVEPEPVKPEPDPVREPPKDQPKEPEAAAPAAAQASQVLAADQKSNEPVDLTNSFVQGVGTAYVGGNTTTAGTGTAAVRTPPAPTGGAQGGTGTASQGPAAVDRSRSLRLRGGLDWDCPFPPEADTEQIDQAAATIEVAVGTDGRVQSVRLISDPGHGFGRQARACAMSKSFEPALDRDGSPLASTKQFRVTFNR
ncbi:MAG: energy transducer TonB [Polyangiaceae bacterium]